MDVSSSAAVYATSKEIINPETQQNCCSSVPRAHALELRDGTCNAAFDTETDFGRIFAGDAALARVFKRKSSHALLLICERKCALTDTPSTDRRIMVDGTHDKRVCCCC